MTLTQASTIYFSGIGGIGMSGLAQLLHADGKRVIGSDLQASIVTETVQTNGITVHIGQDGSGITDEIQLCIYSDAVPETHPERLRAKELGIPSMSYFEAVGEYGTQFETMIAVSGTHGKSTTTAMIANMFINAGLDPTVIVGSMVKEFNSNARHGSKQYFIVEACEHQAHMLHLHPNTIVLTNIEADHLDYYRDLNHIIETFQTYVSRLPADGVLIANADDAPVAALQSPARRVTYALQSDADLRATDMQYIDHLQQFSVSDVPFTLRVPGAFNVSNALAAIATARQCGIADDVIQRTLAAYGGIWRRFQILGTYRGATIISDYGHHPTEVRSTIQATAEFYKGKRVIVIFQPHQRARTQALFEAFTQAFDGAQLIAIQEIYDVAGREEGIAISSQALVDALATQGKNVSYTADAHASEAWLNAQIQQGDVVLFMGAGDIYKLAEQIVTSL